MSFNNYDKLIILDRDGVINSEIGRYISSVEDFVMLAGATKAIAKLKQAGYYIAIATNQAGIEKGIYTHQTLLSIHCKMLTNIRDEFGDIDRIVYCSSSNNNHKWRKPNPGMLLDILADFPHIEPKSVMFAGDYLRDVEASVLAGCQPVLIKDIAKELLDSELKSKSNIESKQSISKMEVFDKISKQRFDLVNYIEKSYTGNNRDKILNANVLQFSSLIELVENHLNL